MAKKYNWPKIQEYYDSKNCTRKELLEYFSMPESTLKRAVKERRLVINGWKKPILTKYNWSEIQAYYDEGYSTRETAEFFELNLQSIYKAASRGDFITRSPSEAGKLRFKKFGPNVMGEAARRKISKQQSLKNNGGKSKWFTVAGKKVQGTWERDLALAFEELNIKWERCKPWPYTINEEIKHYTPDFYLPDYDLYIEVKGYWWGNDREKMDAVIEQYPDRKIEIIEADLYKEIT